MSLRQTAYAECITASKGINMVTCEISPNTQQTLMHIVHPESTTQPIELVEAIWNLLVTVSNAHVLLEEALSLLSDEGLADNHTENHRAWRKNAEDLLAEIHRSLVGPSIIPRQQSCTIPVKAGVPISTIGPSGDTQ